jgi:hypothetical protein
MVVTLHYGHKLSVSILKGSKLTSLTLVSVLVEHVIDDQFMVTREDFPSSGEREDTLEVS